MMKAFQCQDIITDHACVDIQQYNDDSMVLNLYPMKVIWHFYLKTYVLQ